MADNTSTVIQTPALVEPDPAVWDAFVAAHPHGHLLQLSPWSELKTISGWRSLRVAVGVPTADGAVLRLLAGAQLLWQTRFGLSVAYVPRGPLLADDPVTDTLLLAGLRRAAQRRRAIFLRIEPNRLEDEPQSDRLHSWFLRHAFQPAAPIQPRSSIQVDLTPAPAQMLAACSKGHRADIRRAERQGVSVRSGTAGDLDVFYAIMQATGERAAFGVHSRDYYQRAWQCFQPRSQLLLAEQDNAVVAAHLVFADAHSGYYLYSGASDSGLKAGANHLLQWHALQWAREQDCTRYDLWGIPDALGRAAGVSDADERAALEAAARDDPLYGVFRFKKGFGGRIVRFLPAYDQVYIPALYRLWRRRMAAA